jgi:preprotein translocase subunit YajC
MTTWILLQADGGAGIMGQVFLFGSIILIMYFFMIRPQQKKQKETKVFLEGIKKGDVVVTIGGIHGKVNAIEGDILTVDLDKGMKIKVEKSAISTDYTKKATGTK